MPLYCIVHHNKERFPCIAASVEEAREKYMLGPDKFLDRMIVLKPGDRPYWSSFSQWARQGNPIVEVDPRPFLKEGFDGLIRIYHTGLELPLENLETFTPGKLYCSYLEIDFHFEMENGDPVLLSTLHYQGRDINWKTLSNGMNDRLPPMICELCGKPGVWMCAECAGDLMVS